MNLVERTLISQKRSKLDGVEFWFKWWREVWVSPAASDLDGFPDGMFPRLEQRHVSMEREPVIELLI